MGTDEQPFLYLNPGVISGQIPRLNGYYFVVLKNNRTDRFVTWAEPTPTLFYGHVQRRKLMFLKYYNDNGKGILLGTTLPSVNSAEYQQALIRCFGVVEGRGPTPNGR
jgi:hypothetical protein